MNDTRDRPSPASLPTSGKVLLLFAHPAYERSAVNRALLEALRGLAGVTLRDLYERYPDFDIDVPAEQELLAQHDWLIVQHPLFWFSTPALLKQWLDLVLEHGWAYGEGGTALQGKKQLSVITSGGRAQSYSESGLHGTTLLELLSPLRRTFSFCGFDVLAPFVVHGTHRLGVADIKRHASDYRRLITAILDGRLDLDAARQREPLAPRLAALLDEADGRSGGRNP